MCGIAGIITKNPQATLSATLALMTREIAHRGPDDDGHYTSGGIALGMRRLSIIDVSTGRQPMLSDKGTVIVFNGEIYNYKELKEELQRKGAVFHTSSDTEVILKLYDTEGMGCLKKLRGMFSIALYDPAAAKVFLARDRMGIKPLYYSVSGEKLVFASEIKSLLIGLDSKPDVSRSAIADYLFFRFVPSPQTMWEGVLKLEPGHFLTLDLQNFNHRVERYWACPLRSSPLDPARNYEGEFETLFLECVQSHILASDVPVGVLLSGGLDSSAVAAAIVELGHKNLSSYTIRFEEGGEYSEEAFARQVAGHCGLKHAGVSMEKEEFMRDFEELTYYTDEPLADLAAVPLRSVCRRAAQDVKVLLSGEGADEIFAGYHLDATASWLHRMKVIEQSVPKGILRTAAYFFRRTGRLKGLSVMAQDGWENIFKELLPHSTRVWTGQDLRPLLTGAADDPESALKKWYQETQSPHPLDQFMEVAMRQWLVEDLLMKADKMSMAESVELRVPFLDHKMVEWASTLPLECKVGSARGGWTTKKILRDFARKRLPDQIINRPKKGFPVPCYTWLKEDNFFEGVQKKLLRKDSALSGFLNVQAMGEPLQTAHRGDLSAAHKVWSVMVLDQWLERWAV